jgi:CheY-like chemotaxis protein
MRAHKGKTILVVEDDPDIRAMLVDLFDDAGFETSEAENGRAALSALSAAPKPDIILLDMVMPVMNGAALLEALEAAPRLKDIPVVVVSADTRILPAGAVALVRKPFDAQKLLDIIAAHLRPNNRA